MKSNISMFDTCSLPQQHEILHNAFNSDDAKKTIVATTEKILLNDESHEVLNVEIVVSINEIGIGAYSKSQVLPFLLTYEIFYFNVHNFLTDLGVSSNIMLFSVFHKINVVPKMTKIRIIQLDRTYVKVKGELKYVLIRLSSDLRVHQIINIIVVDIP